MYSVIVVGANDYKWTWKAIEFELAFLYEVFFTSNEFLHFYDSIKQRVLVFGHWLHSLGYALSG